VRTSTTYVIEGVRDGDAVTLRVALLDAVALEVMLFDGVRLTDSVLLPDTDTVGVTDRVTDGNGDRDADADLDGLGENTQRFNALALDTPKSLDPPRSTREVNAAPTARLTGVLLAGSPVNNATGAAPPPQDSKVKPQPVLRHAQFTGMAVVEK
jgi:hypothetical protein